MPKAICSKCQASHNVAEKYCGKTIKCLKCGTAIDVAASGTAGGEVVDLATVSDEENFDNWNLEGVEEEGVAIPKKKKEKKTKPSADKRKPYKPDSLPLMPILIGGLALLVVGLGVFALTRKGADGKSVMSNLSRLGEEDKTEERMKAIAAGMYSFQDTHQMFPFSFKAVFSGDLAYPLKVTPVGPVDAAPLLSWRVHLLPYVGEDILYGQFHLDEAWDSPHNKTLLSKIPKIYQSRGDSPESGKTRFQVFTSKDQRSSYPFREWLPLVIGDVHDGTANTILLAEAGIDKAVAWTQPVDMEIDPEDPFACLGNVTTPSYAVVMIAGDFHWLRKDVSKDLMHAMQTSSGGEDVGAMVESMKLPKKRR